MLDLIDHRGNIARTENSCPLSQSITIYIDTLVVLIKLIASKRGIWP